MNRAFPATRLRRMRKRAATRQWMQETSLHPSQLISPLFVIPGSNQSQTVLALPGVERLSIDRVLRECELLQSLGVLGVALFPVVEPADKSKDAKLAYDPNGLIATAIKQIKAHYPDMIVIADVALDPYTSHGQDGILDDFGYVANDATVKILVRQALMQAEAGADVLAPSDMMDGRVGHIRQALESQNFTETLILSYAVKYASKYYEPFRDAVGSAHHLKGASKQSYQMDPGNWQEAFHEAALDIQEGADMLMIKPGMPYLDVLRGVKDRFQMPTAVYHVSGEYAMLQAAFESGVLQKDAVLLETMRCFRRAGADVIFTYFAKYLAQLLKKTG